MFENVDRRRTDGRCTPDAGVTGILLAHFGAFGSGELIIALMKCEDHHTKKLIKVLPYNCLY